MRCISRASGSQSQSSSHSQLAAMNTKGKLADRKKRLRKLRREGFNCVIPVTAWSTYAADAAFLQDGWRCIQAKISTGTPYFTIFELMIRKYFLMLVLLCSLPAVASPPPEPFCFLPGKPFETRFLGDWELVQWKVGYSVFMRTQQVCLLAQDLRADEWFDIPEAQWDGKELRVVFVLPSTKWHTESRLSVADGGRVRDEYRHADGQRVDYWTRRK